MKKQRPQPVPAPATDELQRLKLARAASLISLIFIGLAGYVLTFVHTFLPASTFNRTASTLPVLAHTFAFPLQIGVGMLTLSAITASVLLIRKRMRQALTLPWGVVPILAGLSGTFLILSSTYIALPKPHDKQPTTTSSDVVIVSWNAHGHFDEHSANTIFNSLDADIAVLPELTDYRGDAADRTRLQEELAAAGLNPMTYKIFESPPTGANIPPVTVIVRKGLGSFQSVEIAQTTFGALHLVPPANSELPEIIAVHTAPPLPGLMADWRKDLTLISGFAEQGGSTAVIAGDFNATMRHGNLSTITTHTDALAAVSGVLRGTWPRDSPQMLRSSIDHVLVPRVTYAVGKTTIVDILGSDHAAVAATLSTNR